MIKTYKDKKIEFILRMLKRLDYLAKVEDEVLYDIMFNLESHFIEKDSTILNDKEEELWARGLSLTNHSLLFLTQS